MPAEVAVGQVKVLFEELTGPRLLVHLTWPPKIGLG